MKLPIHRTLTTLVLSGLAITALAAPRPYVVSNTPALAEFAYTVTLIPVPGTVKAVSAKLNLDPQNLASTSGTVSVNLNKLETGIGLRDEHARNYLGAAKHPNAIFTVQKVLGATALTPGKDTNANVVGTFNLNGISRPLTAPINLKFSSNRIAVKTNFDVLLSQHNIFIPGGDNKVSVKVQFELEPNVKP
jgi:polyisoprenoid-binding protein YceI